MSNETTPISSIVDGKRSELVDMPWPEYKAFPALNGSVIVHGRKSMLHLKHAWDHGRPGTDAMQFGRIVHGLLFKPEEAEVSWRPWEGRRAGNEYKAFKAEAEAEGAEAVKATGQYSLESAVEAAKSFLRNDRVQKLIKAGTAEQAVLGVEHEMQHKGLLDWVSTSEHALTDLKTADGIEPNPFGKAFFNYGYDIKLGLYRRWLDRVTNDHWPVEVIVLENKQPHDVAVVPVPDAVLDAGVEKALDIIQRVRRAIDEDQWPGVAGADFLPLQVPYYVMAEDDLTGYEDAT